MTAEYKINENLSFSLDASKTRLNNNFAFIGSPGSGKTHLNTYNLMNMIDRSHVIVDVKGNLSGLLDHFEKHGYKTYHFNLVDLDHSDTYSLFSYIDPENLELDLLSVARTLYGEIYSSRDPYWDLAATKLLMICLCGIYEAFGEEKRDLYKVNDYIDFFYSDRGVLKSKINDLVRSYKKKSQNSSFSKLINSSLPFDSEKTFDCILQSLDTRVFTLLRKKVCTLVSQKGVQFEDFLKQKTCLIITIDDADTTLHSVCGLFLTQLFQYLYRQSRNFSGARLPIPVQFHLDDFGSYYINNFSSIISTARSRNIGITCLFQSQGQLKHLYGIDRETIMQCFDTIMFFGGVDDETTSLIAQRSGNSFEYIATQDLNTCYIVRRTIPVLYEKVENLSDFQIPDIRKHDTTKTFKNENEFDFLNEKTASNLYVELKRMENRMKEQTDRESRRAGYKKQEPKLFGIYLKLHECKLLRYVSESIDTIPANGVVSNINRVINVFNIIPEEDDTVSVEVVGLISVLPDIYAKLESIFELSEQKEEYLINII